MKIQTQKHYDVINIEDINEDYLVVAVINGNPTILSKGWGQDETQLRFKQINKSFTEGNGWVFSNEEDTIQKMISYLDDGFKGTYKIEAFHQRNWKDALQWLINNAE
jgi:hypothetical protein